MKGGREREKVLCTYKDIHIQSVLVCGRQRKGVGGRGSEEGIRNQQRSTNNQTERQEIEKERD